MKQISRRFVYLLALAALSPLSVMAADAPTTAPTPQASGRTTSEIMKDFGPVISGLRPVYIKRTTWSDPEKRAALAPAAQPHLQRGLDLLDEMVAAGHAKDADMVGADFIVEMAAVFGDTDLQTRLETMTKGENPQKSWAMVGLMAASFYKANGDAAVQGKVLDQMEALAATDPSAHMSLMRAGVDLYSNGNGSKEISDRLDSFVTTTLKSNSIKQIKASKVAEAKRKALENKPIVLAGVLRDGTKFTSEDMKGKVILVDFWASWCGPCKAELPRVKKAYADFHDKGLEVIGVSCDYKAADLTAFLAKNPDMPWPQLFDEKKPGWNELAKGFGINGIPTMFLIDKTGVCRSVTARENFEEIIPKLLAEQTSGT